MTNEEHAKRLERIAAYIKCYEDDNGDAVAVLAGAAALRGVEELHAVVRDFRRMYCGHGMKTEAESLDGRAAAALKRLEEV